MDIKGNFKGKAWNRIWEIHTFTTSKFSLNEFFYICTPLSAIPVVSQACFERTLNEILKRRHIENISKFILAQLVIFS